MVSPNLLESSAVLQGFQDNIINTIKPRFVHQSTLGPLNALNALNTAPRANEILAKLSADFILPKGLKWAWYQVHAAILANLFTLSGYYARFGTGLVKDIN